MSHNYGDTIPLNASSAQSDMDEIESLMYDAPSATILPAAPSAASPASVSVAISYEGFGSPPNTLTEPVWDTVKRDLARIVSNRKLVIFPNPNREDPGKVLRDWDLWGPFFIVFLGLTLSWSASVKKIGSQLLVCSVQTQIGRWRPSIGHEKATPLAGLSRLWSHKDPDPGHGRLLPLEESTACQRGTSMGTTEGRPDHQTQEGGDGLRHHQVTLPPRAPAPGLRLLRRACWARGEEQKQRSRPCHVGEKENHSETAGPAG